MPSVPFAPWRACAVAALFCAAVLPAAAQTPSQRPSASSPDPGITWVRIGRGAGSFEIARTETTVGQFRRFVQATGILTRAEQRGGGQVYELGWTDRPGWTWARPFGRPAADDEPAVHISFGEAQAYCRWAGGRLPSDAEWVRAAYLEQRPAPPAPFVAGRRYAFPTGDSAAGAQCLDDCGPAARKRAHRQGARLVRGHGHALAGSTPAGVNGLFEMGGNAWEWVDGPPGAGPEAERGTRGGSWWYGAAQMREDHRQSKPPDTTVVYIGWRCARGG